MKKTWLISILILSLAFIYDGFLMVFFTQFPKTWAYYFKNFGHLPAFYLGFIALLGYAEVQSFLVKAGLKTLVILGSFGLMYALKLSDPLDVILATLLCYISLIFWVQLLDRLPKRRMQAWFKLSTAIFLLAFVGSNLIKLFVFRLRPLVYLIENTAYGFNIQMELLNLSFSQQSFPSGHTALAMSMFSLVFLAPHSSQLRKMLSVLAMAYVFLMGISRMVIGDHFASDVVFSLLVMAYGIKSFELKIFRRFD